MLEKFRAAKRTEVERLMALAEAGGLPPPLPGPRPSFSGAILDAAVPDTRAAVIAEYKRASPSKGDINLGLAPADVARIYAANGAACVSVLTEEAYFKGSLAYLDEIAKAAPGMPLLRKDFLVHPLQVAQTAAHPASALLLIVRMLSDADLTDMLRVTYDLGLEAVVEVFDETDLDRAEAHAAHIIQVNNRDLDTLTVDLAVSERLVARKRPGRVWISASGISRPAEAARMAQLGFDAVLVGTSIMSEADPGAALAALVAANAGEARA
ncbi:indole-3-glycerol phosphate synthase TrpC [Desulfolutivibrio sulfoxidireducens]|uniref:indole-3-glycerol phosphate synthase TrpC n=1 Tax=Desulfolutivibrio sulfoxidireducens TaxID=2773299 RepID=UPI00159E83CC|nr:indole-3-glycerol-phosphate synthase [Desulfolutivibrio sulfoxidireducens]QLA15223.1 indole-3-glycerol-phosphate synthase [Desulfolutivibrio sulfoxidireducens]